MVAPFHELKEGTAPTTPATGYWRAYFKSDGLYVLDDAGVETKISTTTTLDLESLNTDQLILDDGTELTIATGAITVTKARHLVDTEADAASDDLTTISGLASGEIVILSPANDARTVVVKNGTGNIVCATGADITLDDSTDMVLITSVDSGTTVSAIPFQGITAGGGGGGGDNIVEIATTTLGSAQTSVTFSSIAGTYDHLQVVIAAETDRVSTEDPIVIQFNTDTTGTNYFRVQQALAAAARVDNAVNNGVAGYASGTTSSANAFGTNIIDIPFYTDTTVDRTYFSRYLLIESTTVHNSGIVHGRWNNTSAITQITFIPGVGTNFVTGSKFTLYGIVSS